MLVANRTALGGCRANLGAGPATAITVGISGTILTGIAVTSTLFTYGIASTSDSKLVKTTGYILSALSAIYTLAILGGTVIGTIGAGASEKLP